MREPNQSTFAKPHFCIRRAKTHFMSTNRSPKLFAYMREKLLFRNSYIILHVLFILYTLECKQQQTSDAIAVRSLV